MQPFQAPSGRGVSFNPRFAPGKGATVSLFLVSGPFESACMAPLDISSTSTRLGETILQHSKERDCAPCEITPLRTNLCPKLGVGNADMYVKVTE